MNVLKLFLLCVVSVLSVCNVAMADDMTSFFTLPEGMLPQIIAWVVGVQVIAFGIGKGLTEIAVHTDNKYDNMAANAFTKLAWFLGSMISKFGWGMPKQVVLKRADKLNGKE